MHTRLIALTILAAIFLVPAIAAAQSAFPGLCEPCSPGTCQDGLQCQGGVCQYPPGQGVAVCNPLGSQQLDNVIGTAADMVFTLALFAAPIIFVIAGFMLVTGGGDPQKVTQAKNMIIWTVIGLVLILLSRGIVFVIQDIFNI